MSFTHLHLHTHYSFLEALGKPKAFISRAKELWMDSLAITDSGNLYGAFEFYSACKKEGIKPIIGLEVSIAQNGMEYKGRDDITYTATLLAKNFDGYQNLIQLVTQAYLHGFYYKPRVDFKTLEKHSSDIIFMSGDHHGEIAQHIATDRDDDFVRERIAFYEKLYGAENVYLEMQPHTDRPNQAKINDGLERLAKSYGYKLVATQDIHYITEDDAEAQDLLFCLGDGRAFEDPDRPTLIEGNYSLRSEDEMKEIFAHVPEAVENTKKIADQIDIQIPAGQLLFPHYEMDEKDAKVLMKYLAFCKDDSTKLKHLSKDEWYLRYLCISGINNRYPDFAFDEETIFEFIKEIPVPKPEKKLTEMSLEELQSISRAKFTDKKQHILDALSDKQQEIIYRLEYELTVVDLMGFNEYFIIVADFINWARNNEVPVGPGRGSAAGALLAYTAGITDIDPLKYGLLFERFLNPSRVSMPDIDIDFSDEGRDKVINYVRQKYGEDHVAQICTFGTMAARAAVKDTGKVLDIPFAEMNNISKMMPNKPGITIEESLEESAEFRAVYENDARIHKVVDNAKRLEGTVRQLGVHACAVIIAPEPMTKYCPVQHPPKDANAIVTQFSAYPLEDIGLLKMDFLGLRNLTIIDRCLRIIKQNHGIEIDMGTIDTDDQKVFKVFADGDTTGVFQFESAGMRKYLKDLQPNSFDDIIAMVSLYRPGPLQYIPTYIKRKHGKEKVSYPHASLEEILKVTQGIAVYQEQIMQLVQIFAGFSLGEADILRRAIGKKIMSLLMEQKQKFIEASVEQGHPEKLAKYIFEEIIEPFAGYGFNKSHAACYSMIAYQTAYLKAYYPTEFMTALMVSDEEDMDRITLEVKEANSKDIEILQPSVNESRKHFTYIKKGEIRFGLKAIKGLGDGPIESIIRGREEKKYDTITDFIKRAGHDVINKKSLEALILSGAMDIFGQRSNLFASIEKMIEFHREQQKKDRTSQIGLFDTHESLSNLTLTVVPPFTFEEKISKEQEVIGYMISGHPMTGLERYVQIKSVGFDKIQTAFEEMLHYEETEEDEVIEETAKTRRKKKDEVQLIGYVTEARKVQTKTGKMMMILTCECVGFRFGVVIFPRDYDKLSRGVEAGKIVLVRGEFEKKPEFNEISIRASRISVTTLTHVRERAKDMGVLGQSIQTNDIDELSTEDTTWQVSEEKIEEKVSHKYVVRIPNNFGTYILHELKDFLQQQEKGGECIFVYINNREIDTKFKIADIESLKVWEKEVLS